MAGTPARSTTNQHTPACYSSTAAGEEVQPLLATDAGRVAGYAGRAMMTSAGPVTAASLAGARIS